MKIISKHVDINWNDVKWLSIVIGMFLIGIALTVKVIIPILYTDKHMVVSIYQFSSDSLKNKIRDALQDGSLSPMERIQIDRQYKSEYILHSEYREAVAEKKILLDKK